LGQLGGICSSFTPLKANREAIPGTRLIIFSSSNLV
jgi:hypothetical protein